MPSAGFEIAVPTTEVLQTYALHRVATEILLDNDSYFICETQHMLL